MKPHRVGLHLLSHQPPLHPCARALQADHWATLQLPVDAGELSEPRHGLPVPKIQIYELRMQAPTVEFPDSPLVIKTFNMSHMAISVLDGHRKPPRNLLNRCATDCSADMQSDSKRSACFFEEHASPAAELSCTRDRLTGNTKSEAPSLRDLSQPWMYWYPSRGHDWWSFCS